MSKVEIISSCLVGAASNASPISRLELTPFDLRFLLLSPSQRCIIFHKPQIHQNTIHHLKNSLSRTLDFFPPLPGRLAAVENDDNTACFFLDCNNAGVEAGGVSVSDILEPKLVPEELVSSLFPLNGVYNIEGTSKPLLGVQVTELADGLVIAFTANHSITDGISLWHFINSWSEISRGSDTISKSPVFERGRFGNPLTLPPPLKEKERVQTQLLIRRVFKFSKGSLAKLKAKANSEAGTDRISSLQALSAHLWRSYTRCRRSVDGKSNEEDNFMMAIGARGRIPLPEGYFGTAVYVDKTAINEAEAFQKQNGLGYAAMKIIEFIAGQTKDRAIKVVEDWMKNPVLPVKGNFSFTISGSPAFNVYGNDFEWGKPIGMRTGAGIRFDGNMSTFPSAVGGGVEVHACSTPETLQAMEDDQEFMEAFTI